MSTLPLSWCRKNTEYSSYSAVKLPLSGLTWIPTAEVPYRYSTGDLYDELASKYPEFIVRGLHRDTAGYFMDKGAEAVLTGAEAVVDLKLKRGMKRSVIELSRRGLRHGSVQEISYSGPYKERLRRFVSETSHADEPRLEYLYREGFDNSLRCFVLAAPEDRWLGAVTISIRDNICAHTESILRRKDAPVGVMEAIFVSVMETLKAEGFSQLSLGEVPLVSSDSISGLKGSYKGGFIFWSTRILGSAFNYEGLYNFKNKFSPTWAPVYLAAKPGISKRLLLDLYFKSRFHNLTLFKLFTGLKERFPIPLKTT